MGVESVASAWEGEHAGWGDQGLPTFPQLNTRLGATEGDRSPHILPTRMARLWHAARLAAHRGKLGPRDEGGREVTFASPSCRLHAELRSELQA
jgi:hypothetical protein